MEVSVAAVSDFQALGIRWRDLETRAAGSFFQSWSWTGALAEERFTDPVLVAVTEQGRTIALALFNRIRRPLRAAVLHLGESGDPDRDSPWIEQNGILAEAGREATLTETCLRAVTRQYDVVASGIGEPTLATLRRTVPHMRLTRAQDSPYVDLAALRDAGQDYLMTLGSDTRQQIRRSDRLFAADGPIRMQRAGSVAEALAMLDQLASLHQTAWIARGKPGAFARPFFRRFHDAVVAAALPLGHIAMLRFSVNETMFGYLYNFIYRGDMLAYQSGFAYRPAEPRVKPGLTCHAGAILYALDQGLERYDFLAGDDRYKRNLAGASHRQFWAESGSFWAPRQLAGAVLTRMGLKPSGVDAPGGGVGRAVPAGSVTKPR